MSDKRKLNAEIEKCAKKIQEGVESFDSIWQKFQDAACQVHKKNHESHMKKEVKKLQKLRDQVKCWATSDDVKDKNLLMELRRTVEVRMERFKEVERETRTRTFVKDGVEISKSAEPAERERQCAEEWLQSCITSLNYQADKFDSEMEALVLIAKRKKSVQINEKLESVKARLDRHNQHIRSLEAILRLLDNESVKVELIKEIQEDVDYYIQSNEEPDFPQDFEVNYDQFAISALLEDNAFAINNLVEESKSDEEGASASISAVLEESKAPLSNDHTNSAEAATAEAIAAWTVQPVAAAKEGFMLMDLTQYTQQTSSFDSLESCNEMSLLDTPVYHSIPALAASAKNKEQQLKHTATGQPMLTGVDQQHSAGPTACSGLQSPLIAAAEPSILSLPPTEQSKIWQQPPPPPVTNFSFFSHNVGATSVASSHQKQPPSTRQSSNGEHSGLEFARSVPIPPGFSGVRLPDLDPLDATVDERRMVNQQSIANSFNATPQVNNCSVDGGSHMRSSDDLQYGGDAMRNVGAQPVPFLVDPRTPLQPIELPALSRTNNNSGFVLPGIFPPLLPAPLTKEQKHQMALLEAAHPHRPMEQDSWPWPNGCIWRMSPCRTPSYYPQKITKWPGGTRGFDGLNDETLFWIFYYLGGTWLQILAANTLNARNWRFHRGHRMWFRRLAEPIIIAETYEEGLYCFFNSGPWIMSVVHNYRFEYQFLETGDMDKMRMM